LAGGYYYVKVFTIQMARPAGDVLNPGAIFSRYGRKLSPFVE
jgi:hypothetical protein